MKKWAHNIQTPEDSVKIKFMEIRDEKHVGGYGYGLRIYEGGLEINWSSHQILSSINNWWRELLFSTGEGSGRRRSKCKTELWGLNKVKLTSKFQMRFRSLIHLAFVHTPGFLGCSSIRKVQPCCYYQDRNLANNRSSFPNEFLAAGFHVER